MRALIVAHPDDEIIWFSPQDFDLIVMAFLGRHDRPFAKECRELAISEHPLRERIILLNIEESGFWKDHRRAFQYHTSREILNDSLMKLKKQFSFAEIFTHNKMGEYGHHDHMLVHKLVTSIFTKSTIFCPTEKDKVSEQNILVKNDLNFYLRVKEIYVKNKAWTWKSDYMPSTNLYYSKYKY